MQVLRRGSKGEAVKTLQKALVLHGYGPIVVDGAFGSNTFNALVQFQQAQGISYDGIAGPVTWKLLLTGPAAQLTAPKDDVSELIAYVENYTPAGPIRKALLFALQDVGKKESPEGSNKGPDISHLVDGYSNFWKISGNPDLPWCMIAVSVWTAHGLGLGSVGSQINWKSHPFHVWQGSVSGAYQWADKNGRLEKTPQPGHIYTMPREGSSSDPAIATGMGHTGLIVQVNANDVVTVDGNVSNSVGIRVRKKTDLKGLIRWWN
jgi:hypothetical protein